MVVVFKEKKMKELYEKWEINETKNIYLILTKYQIR